MKYTIISFGFTLLLHFTFFKKAASQRGLRREIYKLKRRCLEIGASYNDGNGDSSGHVRVYSYDGSNWVKVGSDIDGEAGSDMSGWSVSLSGTGDVVAIGAYNNSGNGSLSGHVRVYEQVGGNWLQRGSNIDGEDNSDSGFSVSLSVTGDVVEIDSGNVRVYKYSSSDNEWVQVAQDIDGDDVYDQMGHSVFLSKDGQTVACLAKNEGAKILQLSDDLHGESDAPSTAPSFPTWEIANGIMVDHLDQDSSYLALTHAVGTASDAVLKLTLYKYDCENAVESDNGVSLTNNGISNREASYDVVLARDSIGSSIFLEGTNKLKFCVGAALHSSDDTNNIGGSIVSKKSQFTITFNLENAVFSFEFQTQGESPDDSNTNIEADDNFYEMTACICSESFICDSDIGLVAAQEENSVVFICLKPPAGLSFTNYNMLFSKGNVDPDASSFTYEAMDAPFTSTENSGNDIRVRTQLLSGLFDVGVTGTAKVTGSGTFVFDDNAKDGKEEGVEGNFGMFIGLEEGEECGGGLFDKLAGALSL